jgi:4-hydroxy-3-polyprenylbenzoate decarboxylase
VGITGTTGIVNGVRLLEALREAGVESHLVVSKAAEPTHTYEKNLNPIGDVGAAIASGSFRTLEMIIAPCSIKTMSELANGFATNLLRTGQATRCSRNARRLVLFLRGSPLTAIHIRNMLAL